MRWLELGLCLVGACRANDAVVIGPEPLTEKKIAEIELHGGASLRTTAPRNEGWQCEGENQQDRGIGPLHIPVPPPKISVVGSYNGAAERRKWRTRLSELQTDYVDECCSRPTYSSSTLCDGPRVNTPLVLAFFRERVNYVRDDKSFRFSKTNPSNTDWPTGATPWLALDRDGNGDIDDGGELFGNGTILIDGSRAVHGFEALCELDANQDGRIDDRDPMFDRLLVWSDQNADRRSQASELVPAKERVESIDLDYAVIPYCDAFANCEGERATFRWKGDDGKSNVGAVVDIYLARH